MAALLDQLVDALDRGTLQVIDLTQPLGADTPVIGLPEIFAPSPGITITQISRYDERGPAWYWNTITLGEHTGTHFDAPVHWITGRELADNACDTIPVRRFIGPACVIDLSSEAARDPDYVIPPARIEEWEREHGRIPAGAWVLLRTDWSKRTDAASFLNVDEKGPHSPGLSKEAAELLAHQRDILGLGVETVGTDAGQAGTFDPPFPNHTTMHGAGRFGLASLCNLDRLPARGAVVIAAPLKIVGGSGSPLRVLAITPA
ncbi:MAG: cyclase family protein [Longimicrobiales bacterium]